MQTSDLEGRLKGIKLTQFKEHEIATQILQCRRPKDVHQQHSTSDTRLSWYCLQAVQSEAKERDFSCSSAKSCSEISWCCETRTKADHKPTWDTKEALLEIPQLSTWLDMQSCVHCVPTGTNVSWWHCMIPLVCGATSNTDQALLYHSSH